MKLAFLGDIHGNYMALKACLDYIEKEDIYGIAFLGDSVTDCPYPQKTMELIYKCKDKYPCWFVRGNREEYLIEYDKHKTGWKYSSNSGSLLYTYENLSKQDILFFKSMPVTAMIEINNLPPIMLCHASPGNMREKLIPASETSKKYLKELDADYLICAHVHEYYKYEAFDKTLINCSSVGEPTNGQTKAQFVIFEFENGRWNDELVSVEYNIGKILSDFEASGINEKAFIWPRIIKRILLTGIDCAAVCIKLAQELAKQEEADVNLFDIPEKYWEAAARELEII